VQVVTAAVSREELVGQRAQALADALCGGSLISLLSHLVNPQRLAARDRRKLRDFFNRLDQETRPEKDRGQGSE
jgi:predicted transcriptional regulator